MDKRYIITRLHQSEMSLAIEWAANEGWNPGLHDAACFYQTDPQGFFAGRLGGKIIAIGSAVIYNEEFAFCGFYIVDRAYRGQGYGLALTKARLAYVDERNAGLDGVMNMLDIYARLGYKLAYNNARYTSTQTFTAPKPNPAILPLTVIPFDQLAAYDRLHFPAPRPAFLRCWINQPGGKSLAYMVDGKLCGYGVIRPCQKGFKIGPLFADNALIANELFLHLAHHAQGESISLDIPEHNPNAKDLVKRYQMEKVFETARMYLKEPPHIIIAQIYGITTFELG